MFVSPMEDDLHQSSRDEPIVVMFAGVLVSQFTEGVFNIFFREYGFVATLK